MRTWLHLSLWGAVFLGACSSGGGGGLDSFQLVREIPEYSNESPGSSSSGGSSEGTSTGGNNNTPSTPRSDASVSAPDGGDPPRQDASTPDVSSVSDGSTTVEAGSFTCEDLQACCDQLTGTTQTQCQQIVDADQQSTCSAALSSLKSSSQCE